ncbi:putative Ubiquitin domain-containing protein [Helianthus annuus]|nr:putative Ubiquitin domain-containing protein [Helianthus annuus]KAJ0508049.1 putative Ubiquitin domain-containing protein [Helianthus annuus]KAJ0516387.1 putative Ubiquitin domain-containing protein [Helianthus annuus]KAJ0684391.1 putative Ubiquitin domain-containing protein [Helianthus annuus]KAJ0688334.1 putative Ubiquitin domain-containing protein [Helianthus annuus]
MGCSGSSLNKRDRTTKKLRKPKPWEFPRPVTWSQLVQMRDEFWDSAPHHGGKKGKIVKTRLSLDLSFDD